MTIANALISTNAIISFNFYHTGFLSKNLFTWVAQLWFHHGFHYSTQRFTEECFLWLTVIVPCPLPRKKGGLWNCPCPFICSFVQSSLRPFIPTKLCGHRNSATTGPIHSKSSSLELSWPVDVQHDARLPVGPLQSCSQGRGPSSYLLVTLCKFGMKYNYISMKIELQ